MVVVLSILFGCPSFGWRRQQAICWQHIRCLLVLGEDVNKEILAKFWPTGGFQTCVKEALNKASFSNFDF
jgi:hypothetical protein